MAHTIVHWELMGPDGASLKEFYESIFEWKPEIIPGFDAYFGVPGEEAGLGGAIGQGSADMPSYFTMYVGVDDIDASLAKVIAAGGSTIVPRTIVPDTVTFAMFTDPAGNIVGLVENETPAA